MSIMKRYIQILITILVIGSSVYASYLDELRSYLLGRNFVIDGEFFLSKSKWIFANFKEDGSIIGYYQLLGDKPTDTNPFGWKELNLSQLPQKMQSVGYFIKVDFPYDMQNPFLKLYSWIYVDNKTKSVYKLIGADKGIFKYYDSNLDGVPDPIDSIYFYKQGNIARFYSCKDTLTFKNYSFEKYSKSRGGIEYSCKIGESSFIDANMSSITNSIIYLQIDGNINKTRILAKIFKKPFDGLLSVEQIYGRRYSVCTKKLQPLTKVAPTSENLKKLFLLWGDKEKGEVEGRCFIDEKNLQKMYEANFTMITTITAIDEANRSAKIEILEDVKKSP